MQHCLAILSLLLLPLPLQVVTNALIFMRLRLEGLIVATRAGGFSSLNPVERAQAFLTSALDGCRFSSEHNGAPRLNQQGEPATPQDAALERDNHKHAVSKCVEVLSSADRSVSQHCSLL